MGNALAAIYGFGDSIKRKLRDVVSNPLQAAALGVTRFGDEQNAILNAMESAYPMPGQRSVLVSPQQQDAARTMLADYGSQQGIGAATVWHGSPHKFYAFDASKIGTGEGAQAYGHGLYFAGNSAQRPHQW